SSDLAPPRSPGREPPVIGFLPHVSATTCGGDYRRAGRGAAGPEEALSPAVDSVGAVVRRPPRGGASVGPVSAVSGGCSDGANGRRRRRGPVVGRGRRGAGDAAAVDHGRERVRGRVAG